MEQSLIQLLDTAAIFRYHRSLISEYGSVTTRALGWLAPEGQQARFEVLAGIGDLNDHSVLDAGSGHADLYPFLKARYPRLRYFGVEQMTELLDVAAACYGDVERYKPSLTTSQLPSPPLPYYPASHERYSGQPANCRQE